MNRQLVLLFFALAAGGAIGYAVRGSVEGPVSPAPRTAGSNAGPPPPVLPPELPPQAARTLEDAVGALREPDLPRTDRAITGFVRTEGGEPVSGVRVIAEAQWKGVEPPRDADVETQVKVFAERCLYQRASRAEALTGPDGAFALVGLVDAPYLVRGESDEWSVWPRQSRGETRPGDQLNLLARPIVTFEATVLLPDGTEPATARIGLSTEEPLPGLPLLPWRPDSRKVRVPPGTVTLWAVGGEYDELTSEKQKLTFTAGQRPPPVTFRLGDRPGIRGKVEIPEGETWGYLQVSALKFAGGAKPDPQRLIREGKRAPVRMERQGAFAIGDLSPGTWLVGVTDQARLLAEATVEVTDGMAEVTLALAPPERASYAIVWLEDPTGKPLSERAWIHAAGQSQGRPFQSNSTAVRLPDGSWRIGLPDDIEAADGEPSRWSLSVQSREYGSRQVEFTRSEATVVRVRFEEPAFLEVTVLGGAESDDGGSVQVQVNLKDGTSGASVNLDSEGRGKSGPLAPGAASVQIHLQSPQGYRTVVLEQELMLAAGRNEVSLRMPPLYDLTVLVKEGVAGVRGYLASADGRGGQLNAWAECDRTGRIQFSRVPAGRYRLSVSGLGEGDGNMEVTVPGSSIVRFEPAVHTAFRVHIEDGKGLFARCGLAEGDLVVGIDGQEFTSERQMQALFMLAMTKERAELLVLRGSGQVAIEFPGTEYMKRGREAGGRLEPAVR